MVIAAPVLAQAPPVPTAEATPEATLEVTPGLTPEAAFDALYAHCADQLVRQVRVLTGNPRLATDAVARAFDQAWQQWPEVARDADPVGWLRANACTYALAPWQRWVPAHRHDPASDPGSAPSPDSASASPGPREHPHKPVPLQTALLRLPPEHRRALLLYDGLGLDLPETAIEVESSTLATAGRITNARAALTAALPELSEDGQPLSVGLGALLTGDATAPPATPTLPVKAAAVRDASERGVRRRTVAAFALTAVIMTATAVTMVVAPDHGKPLPPRHVPKAGQHGPDTPGAPAHAPADNPADDPADDPADSPANVRGDARAGVGADVRADARTGLRDGPPRTRPDVGKPPLR